MIFFINSIAAYSSALFRELSLILTIMPAFLGLISFFLSSNSQRKRVLLTGSFFHFLITLLILSSIFYSGGLDGGQKTSLLIESFSGNAENAVFLFIVSVLFCGASWYGYWYLKLEEKTQREDEEGFILNDEPEAVFVAFMLLFLSSMTLVCFSAHMGLLWASIEATTLFSAPLIYFHRSRRSLEATWKYLVVCSVGIAIALLGTFFLSLASHKSGGSLYLKDLLSCSMYDLLWIKLSFIFLFVGYGTKMGLAPLHTWLPDAHSEAPSVVSALLSGALLNCAFLGIWKTNEIAVRAGIGDFSSSILTAFGMLTIFVSAVFILNQSEYKRALAYSSVENMGVMSLLLGFASRGDNGIYKLIFLNALGHSFIKSAMFFTAGMILMYYKTKKFFQVSNMAERSPFAASLWFAGFILLAGAPPSPLFFPKFFILKFSFMSGSYFSAFLLIFLFSLIFAGFARIFVSMVFSQNAEDERIREEKLILAPSWIFFAAASLLFFAFFYFSRGA